MGTRGGSGSAIEINLTVMPNLPTGTVTFLFTDIEGSTRLWEEHPEAMQAALRRHDALVRGAVESNRGYVFKAMGDAFDAAFADASDALAAAVAAQRMLLAEAWEVPGGLRVRMALHTGTAEQRDGDYFGSALNRVARLLAAGHGGQILLSETTRALVEHALPSEVTLRDHGQHRLKDLARPERIFQLLAPGFLNDFPALKSLDSFPNNLPRQLTSFVGRTKEIAEIKSLLSENSLLTLTGSGGAGKTRLALQVAADLVETFADGVWLVELTAISDPGLVTQTAASTLGVREEHRPLIVTLTEFLRPKSLLILLDNCEHVLPACAQVTAQLLPACANLRMLATSQEPLGVTGELTFRVPSLSMPDPQNLPSPEHLTEYEAVRLFVDRAAHTKPGFALTAANAPAVAAVCHRLDGIPLALELAAARVKVISVEEIAARLDDRFRILTGGGRTAPARHQTLRAAMDWSYDLLSENEQRILLRLSVFAGGWTLEAAEDVCAGERIEPHEVLDLLSRLVDKSLVVVMEAPAGDTRYRLLDTVRQYAREKLAHTGEENSIRGRHLAWYLQLAEQAEPELQGPQQAAWLDRLEAEHDNLRASLEWGRQSDNGAESGLRLAGVLFRFWEVRGYWTEGREWLEGALAKGADLQGPARIKALNGAGNLAFFQGDHARAVALGEESLALSRKLGDKRGIASCLNILGLEACRLERYDRAAELGEESLMLSREVGDRWGVAGAQMVLGLVARGQSDYPRAAQLLEQGVDQFRQLGDRWGTAIALNNLGLVAREQGDYTRATQILEETLTQFRELGDKWGIAFSLSNLAIVAANRGDYDRSAALGRESLALRKELGDKRGIVTCLLGLAGIAGARGQPERAAVLFGAAEVLREAIGVPLPPFIKDDYARQIEALRSALPGSRFSEVWDKGRSMAMGDAVDYALAGP